MPLPILRGRGLSARLGVFDRKDGQSGAFPSLAGTSIKPGGLVAFDGHGAKGVATPMDSACLCPSYVVADYRRGSVCLTVGWAKRSVPIVAQQTHSTGWARGVRWARRQGRRHPNGFGLPLPMLRDRGLSARLGVFGRRMGKAERAHRCPATPLNRGGLWRSMGTAPRASPPQWVRLAFAHPTWSRIIGVARCV